MTMLPDFGSDCHGGAAPSLTLPQNSHSNIVDDCQGRVWGSEDMTVLNYYLEVGPTVTDHEALLAHLDEAQERAAACSDGRAPVFIEDKVWLIRGRGVRVGGKNGIGFDYVLEGGGVTWYLNRHRHPSGYNFNGRVLMGSEVLMEHDGARRVQTMVYDGFRALGCRIIEERISRIDIAVDLPWALEEVAERLESGAFISRFKKSTVHRRAGNRWEGLTFGADSIVLRIYDKRSELFGKRSERKLALMNERRRAWTADGPCLRTEWQLRSEALKKWGVTNLKSWFHLRGEIMEYLNTQHTRCADEEVKDRTHSARVQAGDFWTEVIQAFRQVCGIGPTEEVDPLRPTNRFGATVRGLIKQALGCLITAAAIEEGQGGIVEKALSPGEFWAMAVSILQRESVCEDVVGRMGSKMAEIAIAVPTSPVWFVADGRRPCETPQFQTA